MCFTLLTKNFKRYSILDWLGDIGGLHDALQIIGAFIASPFSTFALKLELLRRFSKPAFKDALDDQGKCPRSFTAYTIRSWIKSKRQQSKMTKLLG